MALDHQSWLDKNFLATVLQGGDNIEPRVTVLNFSVSSPIPPGNNYISHIYRVEVKYKCNGSEIKDISLIVKVPLSKMMGLDLFGREPFFYKEVLPKLNAKLNLEFGPQSFHCPVDGMVLRDLEEIGYTMCDKFKQLDYDHCKLALTCLAKFHAASVSLHHDEPELVEKFGKEQVYMGDTYDDTLKPWLKYGVRKVASIAAKIEGCKHVSEILMKKSETIGDSIRNLCKPKGKGLNVLCHGDIWVTNLMFKHDESGMVDDVKFIDYQITRYNSPVLDLIFFIYTSANEEVRETRQQDLYEEYSRTLNSTLEELGCEERLTMQELQEDLKDALDWVIITISNELPLTSSGPDNAFSFDDLKDYSEEELEEKLSKVYHSQIYLSLLPAIIKQFYRLTISL